MEMKTKNRAWVKNVAIILLAVLLVLTLFSNTFMNRSLPEVATAPVSSDSLTVKVRGTGTVKANGTFDVVANQTRKILAVMVKEGDEVEKGDVLFILGEGDSEELAAATAELKQLQQNYQSTALSYPDHTADYEIIESRIHRAEETTLAAERALNQAIDRMNAVATSTNNEGYQNALAQYKQDVAKYYTLIQKYYDDMYSSQKISAQMKQHVDRSLQYSENFTTTDMANAVSELQSRVTEQENSTAIQGVKRLEQELTALENEKTAIEADNAALAQEKNSDLPMVINALDARITELNGLIAELQTKIDSDPDSANVAEAQAKIQEYKAMQEQCKTEIAAHEARKTEIDSVIAANNSRLAELAAEISNKQAEVTAAKTAPSTSEAYAKLDAIKAEIEGTVKAFETIKKDLSTMLLEQ
ncbi:MAG: biotin/lipoyl-binding protein, partial [Oscillospiraceae bacterium]|nr:biotin/lipoyl-binding protein [Oscillospiraceae bacterium]